MKKTQAFIFALTLILTSASAQDLKSPADYLGYELGTQFTMHNEAVSYVKYIADNSEQVIYETYGKTYEGRELIVAFISSRENIQDLEQLRKNNLINIGLLDGEAAGKQIPFIWLSYNVHGNESVGMEAALRTLYTLAAKSYDGVENWLKECIIVIDPCQNPDGRDRYASQYSMHRAKNGNVNADDWSHHEGWPGSRSNHYLFDLNRDWMWQTQIETIQRLRLYNQYMPHVHADFHEMGSGSTFFFAPGADPWHEVITPWQHEFHNLTGIENAELFNEKFRLYFTRESFDLFCPSFGDTWPLFNGAMGFTYEQGGGGSAGIAVKRVTNDTLTLKERIDGHFMASMATIKVSYMNRDRLIKEFNKFFRSGLEKPVFEYGSVIIKGSNEKSSIKGLLELLDRNQIKYSNVVPTGKRYKGFDYLENEDGEVTLDKGDILISSFQPQSNMVKVMFEPDSRYTDSLSYDLTAWALPYVYDLKSYAVKERLKGDENRPKIAFESNSIPESPTYAFLADWKGFSEVRLMSELYKKKFNIRYATKVFTSGKKSYSRGTLIIARADNRHLGDKFEQLVVESANKCGVTLDIATSGLSEKGIDLGSNYASVNKQPEIALIAGEGSSSGSFGQLWYYFENEIDYPVSVLGTDWLASVDLSKYDVVLLPSGTYTKFKEQLINYVKEGGRLIVFERAISMFADEKTTNLFKSVEERKKEVDAKKEKTNSSDSTLLKRFEDRRREGLKERSAGSIYKVALDDSHPYTFGLGKEWFIMKRSANWPFLSSGSNIGYILDSNPVSGFAGSKFQEEVKNTMVIASERMGGGEVVYISDDPYYRAYWKSGRVLLGNLIFR
ncbi:MAG TPA: M14 family metallopeptidase [Bacteroidales bacterium]|nr:M14 family metallopeptidase [Bacteroidales bacterium]